MRVQLGERDASEALIEARRNMRGMSTAPFSYATGGLIFVIPVAVALVIWMPMQTQQLISRNAKFDVSPRAELMRTIHWYEKRGNFTPIYPHHN